MIKSWSMKWVGHAACMVVKCVKLYHKAWEKQMALKT